MRLLLSFSTEGRSKKIRDLELAGAPLNVTSASLIANERRAARVQSRSAIVRYCVEPRFLTATPLIAGHPTCVHSPVAAVLRDVIDVLGSPCPRNPPCAARATLLAPVDKTLRRKTLRRKTLRRKTLRRKTMMQFEAPGAARGYGFMKLLTAAPRIPPSPG